MLEALDNACLLDNAHFAAAHADSLRAYRQAPYRTPAGAGQSYPADPDELRQQLQGYLDAVEHRKATLPEGRGLVSPHIDYARGGPTYAQAWMQVAEMVQAAEMVIVLGTDHYSEDGLLTLTGQNFATPFGVLPTATDAVEQLAEAIGPERAFANELHHRGEHSIELAAVWLHYLRGERPCPIVPVLCGSFQPFVQGPSSAAEDPELQAFVATCRALATRSRVLVVAAADLAHVGPAFGGRPLGWVERAQLQSSDEELMERVCAGDAEGFLTLIQGVGDRNNVCGVPPIYLALRVLEPVEGERVAYERCPADGGGTSWVSVCGIVFR
jgi:AmmeMemoRadiSam system protein B